MVDVRKGDRVVLHGSALIDGLTKSEAVVAGVSAGGKIVATITRFNGHEFTVPGTAVFGDPGDGGNWWEWTEAGEPVRDDPVVVEEAVAEEAAEE